jgi:hypothetical protein
MISSADFDNWIQERGLYYPREWDPHYSALLSTNDKGEQPLRGGLLVGPSGRGLSGFREYDQLRALAPAEMK